MLAGLGFAHAQLRVLSTAPVNHEHDITRRVVDIDDDLLNERADEPLLRAHLRARCAPRCLKIGGQHLQSFLGYTRRLLLCAGGQAGLAVAQARHGGVPPSFKLSGYQSVVRIHRFITSRRKLDFVLGLLPLQREGALAFIVLKSCIALGHEGSFHCDGLDGNKDLPCNGVVRTPRAKRDAWGQAVHGVARAAGVAWLGNAASTVGYLQHATAAPAAKKSCQQRAPPAPRLRAARPLGERVAGQARLGLLELLPGDVGLVVIAQEHRPCLHRSRIAVSPAHGTINNFRLYRRLAVRIGARVEWILQHTNDIAIDGVSPRDVFHSLTVGGPGELQRIAAHVCQYLTGTAEALEELEYQSNGILNSPVRIHHQAGILGPDVSNRDRHSQLTTACLRHDGIEQPSSQHRQLKLAHGALEAEQQAIVGRARVIDTFGIDDPSTDETTELDQVVPVAAVACETGRFEAEHRTDDTLADLAHEISKAGPIDCTTRRTTEILIDDRHITESVGTCEIGEIILAPLALEILLDLRSRRLSHVDDSSAAKHTRRQLTAHHRPPRLRRLGALLPAATLPEWLPRSPGSSCRASRVRVCREEGTAAGPALLPTMMGWLAIASALSCGRACFATALLSKPTSCKIVRTCVSAPTVTRGEPVVIRAHATASNIHAGITSPERSGITQMRTTSPRRTSRYCTSSSRPCAGCHR